jgi:hypothetical protein
MKVEIRILLCSWENMVICGIGLSSLIFPFSQIVKFYNLLASQEIGILVPVFVMYLYSSVFQHLSSWKQRNKHLFLKLKMHKYFWLGAVYIDTSVLWPTSNDRTSENQRKNHLCYL